MPHFSIKDPNIRSSSCLLQSLNRFISLNNLNEAINTLPILARCGIRLPFDTLSLLLSRCLRSNSLSLARQLHLYLHVTGSKRNYPKNPLLANHIISLEFCLNRPDDARNLFDKMPTRNVFSYNLMLAGYVRLGMVSAARRLFEKMPGKDVVSWNTMITGFARTGKCRNALEFYLELRRGSLGYNPQTFSGLINACVKFESFKLTQQVHGQVFVIGLLALNVVIGSSLVDAYAKGGWMDSAGKVFDEMGVRDMLCWTILVYGYAKIGDLVVARRLFDEMPERNSVSWTVLIGGYVRFGFSIEAIDLFRMMMVEGVRPDQFTFSSGLCACAAIASLKHGKQIHAHLLRTRFRPNAIVLSSLVDMYSKCGDLEGGRRIFNWMSVGARDTVMWNTMMSAEAQHGHGQKAIRLFEEMVGVGARPDANTFLVLLSACGHSGLVAEGVKFFESMAECHGIVPKEDHYCCLVDMLGREGHLEEAVKWISNMRCQSRARAWNVLLEACMTHGNMLLAKEIEARLLEVVPLNPAPYGVRSNIYAEEGRWEGRKEHAVSWIEIDNVVHFFGTSDKLLPLSDDLDGVLEFLASQMGDYSFVT